MNHSRLIAVDPSLTCSGWALFDLESKRLLGVGKIRSIGPESPMAARLADLQDKINSLLAKIGIGSTDVLVCEGPATMKDPRAALLVEQVRGIFETLARQLSATVPGRLNPRTVQYEVMGLKGAQLTRDIVKSTAAGTVWSLYKEQLLAIGFKEDLNEFQTRHQDIIDAVLIGSLAVERVQSAQSALQPLSLLFEEQRSVRPRSLL